MISSRFTSCLVSPVLSFESFNFQLSVWLCVKFFFRQEQLTYSITPKLQPVQVDLHSDLAFIERTVKYNKYPTPKDALQDSVTTFFVDHGTYMPAKSKTVQHSVLIGPEICSDKVKLVIGYSYKIFSIHKLCSYNFEKQAS